MIGFAVVVGAFVSRPTIVTPLALLFGFLTGFLICAYSMVVNDIYDIEVDKINRPDRPIPSGEVSPKEAWMISWLLLGSGLLFSLVTLNIFALGVAALYAVLSWLYNSRAKKAGLVGNLIVASSLAIPFIYGGIVTGGSITGSLLLMMAFTAMSAGVGREVVKAMADVEGDAKRGIRSVPRTHGERTASFVGAGFFLLAVFVSWIPLIFGLANWIYTIGVIVPDTIFIYLAASILKGPNAGNAYRVKKFALAGMTVGLVVFIGGAF